MLEDGEVPLEGCMRTKFRYKLLGETVVYYKNETKGFP